MKRSFFTALALVALAAATALLPDLAMAASGAAAHASSAFSLADLGSMALAAAPALAWPAKFAVRDGFVASTFAKLETAPDRFEIRQNDYYGGEVVDLSEADAALNLHKLEPKDDTAAAYLLSKAAAVEQIPGPQGVDAIVAKAVSDAIAAFSAGLAAAQAAPPAAPADTGGKGSK